jgi:small redox-active disulfide protein 2
MKIQILGPGCARCRTLEGLVRDRAAGLADPPSIEKIEDFAQIASYGVLSTPGLVIDGTVVSSGRIPSPAEIEAWLAPA